MDQQLLIEGLKLMAVGLSTVFIFLGLMIVVITVVAKLTKKYAEAELVAMANSRRKAPKKVGPPVVVLSAAVAAYEADENK